MGNKVYKEGEVAHIYRRSRDGRILFYTPIDYLVIFIIVCVAARKYGIEMLGFCPMVDHLHLLVRAKSAKDISSFMRDLTSQYAVSFNSVSGESGPVFDDEYGLANKLRDKVVRTGINYLYNNPVEKKLCSRAEDWQWNFLAYMGSTHPFSEKLRLANAPWKLRKAVKYVRHQAEKGNRISYRRLTLLYDGLDEKQSRQLTDRIISSYNVIDYGSLLRYYASYDAMVLAMKSNTGSEYDIREEFNSGSDRAYFVMTKELEKDCISGTDRILSLSVADRVKYADMFVRRRIASRYQVRKYFHL